MAAVGFRCPGCGASIADQEEQDILVCEHCGTTLTKEITEYDRSLRYLREKEIRYETAKKEAAAHRRTDSWKATMILGMITAAGLIFLYLRSKGIL